MSLRSAVPAAPALPASPVAPVPVTLLVNGREHRLLVEPRRTLLDALRHDLALTGTKKVCDMGNCGACTVLVDGKALYSCLLLAIDCDGREIATIEGLADGEVLDPLQQAFIDRDAFQCGFCTPGQIMNLRAFLDAHPEPTDAELERAVSGNLCRCGAYPNILAAARDAARAGKGAR
jgi:xanthine dehydrogenase YagT iron-sulfur-binding subunit